MTKRSEKVEAPFCKRPVQWTIAGWIAASLIWTLATGRPVSHEQSGRDQVPARARQSSARQSSVDPPLTLIRIDLNAADSRELSLLPGVGPILAQRIVDDRDRLGPFASVENLGRVYGIGPKTLHEIRVISFVDQRTGLGPHLRSAARPPLAR